MHAANKHTDPHFEKSCLLIIDVQNDFTLRGAPAEIEGSEAIIPHIQKLAHAYRAHALPIIHIVRLYKEDGSNVDLARRERVASGVSIVRPGTEGAEIVSALKADPEERLDVDTLLRGEVQELGAREFIIYKPRWGAFYDTLLEYQLKELGCDTVVVAGCNYPNCPRATIYEASERDLRVVAVRDAMSKIYEQAVPELQGIGTTVLTAEEVVKRIKGIEKKG